MKKESKIINTGTHTINGDSGQRGSATIIALMILILLTGFVALAVSRTTNEIRASGNDTAETRAFEASHASLEVMTHNFDKIFDSKLNAAPTDLDRVRRQEPAAFTDRYQFNQSIEPEGDEKDVVITGSQFQGLNARRREWVINSTATDRFSGVEVQLQRKFFNDRIPLFQFGAFFEDDLELNGPPFFLFGGRVHTNGNFFLSSTQVSQGIFLNSRVTLGGELVTDILKTQLGLVSTSGPVGNFVKDASGTDQAIIWNEGSVNCQNPSGINVFASEPTLPNCTENPDWETQSAKFQGNLQTRAERLTLPLAQSTDSLADLIKRGKAIGDMENIGGTVVPVTAANADDAILRAERFANKPGIRISMSDSKGRLPGCAAATGDCGVQLDDGNTDGWIGYQPVEMQDGYKATPLNATRMQIKPETGSTREIWIKVETVGFDDATDTVITRDITVDILSLGVTERAPIEETAGLTQFTIEGYGGNDNNSDHPSLTDSRSVIKLQRFAMPGSEIPDNDGFISNPNGSLNVVARYKCADDEDWPTNETEFAACLPGGGASFLEGSFFARPSPENKAGNNATVSNEDKFSDDDPVHLKYATINNEKYAIVPFPIQMFDTREGIDRHNTRVDNQSDIPAAGVMSMIDIDVANLREFLAGDFDANMPIGTPYANATGSSLKASDIPESQGWVLYISDRRGDLDFDGVYDMEDTLPDRQLTFNEDLNGNNILDTDYGREAVQLNFSDLSGVITAPITGTMVSKGRAATADHSYYRRGVRLINGEKLPGRYDSVNPTNTKGFTVASENGVYVKGNYNATGATLAAGTLVTPSENYLPKDTVDHIPAAIAADAVTILSGDWKDSQSFAYPSLATKRLASPTYARFGMIAGDGITGNKDIAFKPGGTVTGTYNGGLHNFIRYLEAWQTQEVFTTSLPVQVRLHYTGSLINLYNSQVNNGSYKCCSAGVYTPPYRDYTFDTTFMDLNRLPPGTPFFQVISLTGFQRVG